jgi:hypothetical protein
MYASLMQGVQYLDLIQLLGLRIAGDVTRQGQAYPFNETLRKY